MIIKVKRKRNTEKWYMWYAWHPVYLYENDQRFLVWFEYIEKREINNGFDWWNEYRLYIKPSHAYCLCGHEVLQDPKSKIYDAGTETHIICSQCGIQTNWDLNAPVPLFLGSIK